MSTSPIPSSPDAIRRVRDQVFNLIQRSASAAETPPAPSGDGSWPDLDYASAARSVWPSVHHLQRARTLAAAGQRDAALIALRWWIARDPLNPNWWHNQIGTPRLLGETFVLLGDAAPADLIESARPIFARADDFILADDGVTRRPMRWTGANRLWISINRLLASVLLAEPEGIRAAVASAMQEVRVSPRGEEGIQADASFHQHGPLLHNGGYGGAFLSDACFFIAATRGTPWEPEPRLQGILIDFLLDGTRWMLRGEDIDPSCLDREITRPRRANTGYANLAEILAASPSPRAAELLDLAASIRERTAPGALVGNRMFYRSDYMVQHGADARFSVRMYSARTKRAEVVNGEGLLSHHVADGLSLLTRTGAEYRDLFPVWDWQKLPGTTVVQTPHPEPPQLVWNLGTATATGGVSDGEWGACTQHLLTTAHTIRKSWFFGPGALVCLGADLHSGHASVLTTLDQSLLQGPVESDAAPSPLAPGRHALPGARWLRHGPWAFVFPEPTNLTLELGLRTGAWSRIGAGSADPVTRDVFLAWLDHGAAPSSGGYAYAVLTDAPDRAAIERVAASPAYAVLANTRRVQAVWWPEARLLQAAVFAGGEITLPDGHVLRVENEACFQLRQHADTRWTLDAADINQRGGPLTAELRAPDGTVLARASAEAPAGDHAGRTVRIF